ncbi:FAD-dependent oxidoreductase [Nocardiopsis sp. TSRI0078]|uniref:FAD-dependent oxidoreductase n=1 Tax=unclassified Nocardiopsis TaxID=2649073 RepID=UPI00093FAFA7|nr:FAD-dependent oxidoreductase [Nocardiopsis sp. TSRI0078]OKI22844.1 FAD-dependent oxidoreductase [Nocardiopsis sp. TSRI0078]
MRALVCGAGIAGLAAAHRLHTHGWQVTVLEQAPGPRTQGYMIDFFGPGYQAADLMGLLPRLRELGYHIDHATFVDHHGTPRATLGIQQLSHLGMVSLMRPDLERALRETLPDDVQVHYDAPLRQVHHHGDTVQATLADGRTLTGDLLIGADGIHSTVRRLLWGPDTDHLRYLGFHTAAFTFTDPRIHARVDGGFYLTDTTGAQMGLYGLRDGRVAAFTVHRSPTPRTPADPRAELRRTHADLGWLVPRALEHCPDPEHVYYDQVAQTLTPHWSRARTVLLGDACGAVSLLAGQGASLAVGGAFILAEHLASAPTLEAGLRRYEQQWRPEVEQRQRAARRTARWFLPPTRARLLLRRAALHTTGLPGVSRLLAGVLTGKPTPAVREHTPLGATGRTR